MGAALAVLVAVSCADAPAQNNAPSAFPAPGQRTPPGAPAASLAPQIEEILHAIRAADKGQLAVSEEDGRFLRVLVASTGATHVLEIGAASGYSAIWMGLGLRETGGHLVTIEYDGARASEAADNVRRAGLDDVVRVVAGDAFVEIPKLQGTFDLVFLDAWKPDYKKFFEMVFPRVRQGGLFLAHNVVNKKNDMLDFLNLIQSHPSAMTTIVSPGSEGISMTYKARADGAER